MASTPSREMTTLFLRLFLSMAWRTILASLDESSTSRISLEKSWSEGFMSAFRGDAEEKTGSAALGGFQPDLAAVPFHQFLADGQAEAGARKFFTGVHALEEL